MANYKLVNADQLDTDLESVADKIREKAEMANQLAFPSGFIEGIDQCSSLNFSVVGSTTQPSAPKENTIWVNTDTEITGWIFSATEPETPVEGNVWIRTGPSSTFGFNALKKNAILLHLLSAKQYVDGMWIAVPYMIYQDGEWHDRRLWIVKDGVANGFDTSIRTGHTPNITQGNGFLTFRSDYSETAPVATDEKVDLSAYSTIEFDVDVLQVAETTNYPKIEGCSVFLIPESAYSTLTAINDAVVAVSSTTNTGRQTITLDVSDIEGEFYIAICVRTSASMMGEMNVYDLVVY